MGETGPRHTPKSTEVRLYKRRYYILLLFALLSASNSMQWIEYSAITHIVVEFYSVSTVAVNWTSMIYMLTYIVFVLPASWILDKYGLRISVILGSGGNCIGACIRMFSARRDAFWITFVAQTIVGISQMFILGIPPRLAAVWFGPEQVSTACSIGVFGNQLGIAIGFVLPPLLVHMGTMDMIASDLNRLFLVSIVANTIIFLLVIFSFSEKPPLPPSLAQVRAQVENANEGNYYHSLKQLMTNANFVLLFITYGINAGVFYAISTVLSQMVLIFHPDGQESAGIIGLLLVLSGMIGSVFCGFFLDRFHQFKMTTVVVYVCCVLGMLLFTFLVNVAQIWYLYASSILLGSQILYVYSTDTPEDRPWIYERKFEKKFFMTGYLPIGFEFASELTFPIAEGTASGLLNASAQIFGITLTSCVSFILRDNNVLASNLTLTGILIVGTVLTGPNIKLNIFTVFPMCHAHYGRWGMIFVFSSAYQIRSTKAESSRECSIRASAVANRISIMYSPLPGTRLSLEPLATNSWHPFYVPGHLLLIISNVMFVALSISLMHNFTYSLGSPTYDCYKSRVASRLLFPPQPFMKLNFVPRLLEHALVIENRPQMHL